MECHNLQTFHWHYKAYVYTTDVIATFQFFMLEDVELNHNGQQYIVVQNDLNNWHFASLPQ